MTRPFVLRLSTGQMRGSEQGPVGRPPHQFGGHRGWSRTCVVLPMSTWFFPAWPGRAGCWAGCGAPLPQLCQRKLQLADVLLKNFAFTLRSSQHCTHAVHLGRCWSDADRSHRRLVPSLSRNLQQGAHYKGGRRAEWRQAAVHGQDGPACGWKSWCLLLSRAGRQPGKPSLSPPN